MQIRTITTYLLKWTNSKTLAILSADENAEEQKLLFTAAGNEKWYRYFQKQLDSFL